MNIFGRGFYGAESITNEHPPAEKFTVGLEKPLLLECATHASSFALKTLQG